jgi:hypothetical protein
MARSAEVCSPETFNHPGTFVAHLSQRVESHVEGQLNHTRLDPCVRPECDDGLPSELMGRSGARDRLVAGYGLFWRVEVRVLPDDSRPKTTTDCQRLDGAPASIDVLRKSPSAVVDHNMAGAGIFHGVDRSALCLKNRGLHTKSPRSKPQPKATQAPFSSTRWSGVEEAFPPVVGGAGDLSGATLQAAWIGNWWATPTAKTST